MDKRIREKKNEVTTRRDKIRLIAIGAVIFIAITIVGIVIANVGAGVEAGMIGGN